MPRSQFSIRTLLWLTLVVAAFFGGMLFEKERQRRATTVDYSKFVSIAAISPESADHVLWILERAGIEPIIEGSVIYGVSVPPGAESRAISLLRADSAAQKYWIQF